MDHIRQQEEAYQLADRLFREEAGKMAAVLTKLFGLENLQQAEDIVQDTLLCALEQWKFKGVPNNPRAWLYRVAKNKAIDILRRESRFRDIVDNISIDQSLSLDQYMGSLFTESEIQDNQLRMIFACCHPELAPEAQITLILKTLCGLSIEEIANAFLLSKEAITKRLYRTRIKIKEENIALNYPASKKLEKSLDTVLHSLYLLFNEGYNSVHPEELIRLDLCEEAMRLTHMLTQNKNCSTPETFALLALMCYHAARFDSRLNQEGEIILLEQQDRTKWNRKLIMKGNEYLNLSAKGKKVTTFHIEAAIAATHAMSESYEKTDWSTIFNLYDRLSTYGSNPLIRLNRAIVLGELHNPEKALEELLKIDALEENSYYHSAIGEMYKRSGNSREAIQSFRKALQYSRSLKESNLIKKKIQACKN